MSKRGMESSERSESFLNSPEMSSADFSRSGADRLGHGRRGDELAVAECMEVTEEGRDAMGWVLAINGLRTGTVAGGDNSALCRNLSGSGGSALHQTSTFEGCHASPRGLIGAQDKEGVINPYLTEVLQHPQSIKMSEGMLHIRDVEGPKKTGSVETRLEAMEQQVFKCQGMVERGLNANHMMITEFTNNHKMDAIDIGKHLSRLYDRVD
ncbi:40S ribosomal protein S5-1 [Hordeum vulgare]|nr:40S ribosomal protein S5-1 [Hordeum vulgare]